MIFKKVIALQLLLWPVTIFCQIKINKLEATKLPIGIKAEGKINEVISFTDNSGEHIIITSETGIYQNTKFKHENDGQDAELFAYHFVKKQDSLKLIWKVYDFIKDCPVDIEASFIKNTLQVTDLNKNGMAEIWLMYKTVCHGDVSPSDLKIIMYEGNQKHAMRGQTKVKISEKEYVGGTYKFDKVFENSSDAFKNFAKKLWNTHVNQNWND